MQGTFWLCPVNPRARENAQKSRAAWTVVEFAWNDLAKEMQHSSKETSVRLQ